MKLFYLFGWGFPTFMTVLFLCFQGDFGQLPNGTLCFCWYVQTASGWQDYVTFWIPMGLLCLGVGAMLGIVMYQVHKSATVTEQSVNFRVRQQLRPIFFVISFWFIFVWLVTFRFNGAAVQDPIKKATEIWVECFQKGGNIASCGSRPSQRLSYTLWFGSHFIMGIQGFLLFTLYGTVSNNYTLWYGLLTGKGLKYLKFTSKHESSTPVKPRSSSRLPRSSGKTDESRQASENEIEQNSEVQRRESIQSIDGAKVQRRESIQSIEGAKSEVELSQA